MGFDNARDGGEQSGEGGMNGVFILSGERTATGMPFFTGRCGILSRESLRCERTAFDAPRSREGVIGKI